MTEKIRRSAGKKELEELIETCVAIENRKFNPFLLDISEALSVIRRHSSHLRTLEDHLLDMRAITSVARVVGLQSANLRFQSSSLYIDPGMVKEKLEASSREQLAEFLLLSWHPIVELEQLTMDSTKEAKEYWDKMLSFFDRRKRLQLGPFTTPSPTDLEELAEQRVVEEKAYTRRMQELWMELRETAGNEGVEYWKFIQKPDFAQTIARAQLVSFLVSYGYATLQKTSKSMHLFPNDEPGHFEGSPLSLPIPITKEVLVRPK